MATPRTGRETGEWVREQLADAERERREAVAAAMVAAVERAEYAERTQRLTMYWAGAIVVVLVSLLLGSQLGVSVPGIGSVTVGAAEVAP